MNDDSFSSGFVEQSELTAAAQLSGGEEEIYVSPTGPCRLLRCRRMGKFIVVKTLKPAFVGNSFYEEALKKEFNIGYQLDHPYICRTLGWENIPSLGQCLLMEYVDGITLKAFIEQGRLTKELAFRFISQLGEALQYLHSKQIVHRDLKPSNILITHNGLNVKLIDFGLSDCDDYSILKNPAGTQHYMAPEVRNGDTSLDPRVDIFSLGVIMGEMAIAVNSRALASVSRKCTSLDLSKRCSSASVAVGALRLARRRPLRLSIEIAVAAVVVCLLLGVAMLSDPAKQVVQPLPSSSYGNISLNAECRRVLSQVHIRARQQRGMLSAAQVSNDSTAIVNSLLDMLNTDFPLLQQRTSAPYLRQKAMILEQVSRDMIVLRAH